VGNEIDEGLLQEKLVNLVLTYREAINSDTIELNLTVPMSRAVEIRTAWNNLNEEDRKEVVHGLIEASGNQISLTPSS